LAIELGVQPSKIENIDIKEKFVESRIDILIKNGWRELLLLVTHQHTDISDWLFVRLTWTE